MSDTELLMLTEILRVLGWSSEKDRAVIMRYLAIPEVRQLLGAEQVGRATKYRADRLWLFRDLAAAHRAVTVSPKTALPFLQERLAIGPALDAEYIAEGAEPAPAGHQEAAAGGGGGGALATVPPALLAQTGRVAEAFADALVHRIRDSNLLPPPKDKLLNREEAAALLGLQDRPGAVGRRVRPVSPGQWSENMILRYIAALVERAEALPPPGRKR